MGQEDAKAKTRAQTRRNATKHSKRVDFADDDDGDGDGNEHHETAEYRTIVLVLIVEYIMECLGIWVVGAVVGSLSWCWLRIQGEYQFAAVRIKIRRVLLACSSSDRHVEPFRGPCAQGGGGHGKGRNGSLGLPFWRRGSMLVPNSILSRGTSRLGRTNEMDSSGGFYSVDTLHRRVDVLSATASQIDHG